MGLSGWHLFILLVIVLLIFGPKNLPQVGKALGTAIQEFKTGLKGETDKDETKSEGDKSA